MERNGQGMDTRAEGNPIERRALVALRVATGAGPSTSIPPVTDLADEGRVDDEVAERLDEHHVCLAEPAAGLHIDSHLRSITTSALVDPCKVQNAMHSAI